MSEKLFEWCDAIQKSMEIEKQKDKDFNNHLPEPDSIFKTEDFEYGFWKEDDGIVRIRKLKNGYSRHSHIFISKEEIEAINQAWDKKGSFRERK